MGHREDLLAGARRCLEHRGYARTTARDLVAESGTNLASIGYHFGSKDALLTAAIAASFEEWSDRITALAVADGQFAAGDPLARLGASWTAMLDTFAEYRGLAVAFVEALAQVEHQPELRAVLAGGYARIRSSVAAVLTDVSGGAVAGERATALASLQMAICDGLLVQWLLDPDAAPRGDAMADAFGTALAAALR